MRLTLKVHGGFAAAMRREPAVMDTASLDPQHADRIAHLVRAIVASPTASAPAEPMPDAMSYTLVVEQDGKTDVVKQRDGDLTAEFGQLLDQFTSGATARKK